MPTSLKKKNQLLRTFQNFGEFISRQIQLHYSLNFEKKIVKYQTKRGDNLRL
uniref:Uncharacterized protein n=1 Tax=Octopus bimaculoides TaxID=37653 RepID=A0A0L8HV90_OCTBM